MNQITIDQNGESGYTSIPNIFIDTYMKDANDAQLKVYLFLIRKFSQNSSFTISDIADEFNHTEKDVMRSLKYWESKSVISLSYDSLNNISGITLASPSVSAKKVAKPPVMADIIEFHAPETPNKNTSVPTVSVIPVKPEYSNSELMTFREENDASSIGILDIVEGYLQKPLTAADCKSLLYIHKELGFSFDMTDSLIQHCLSKGIKDLRKIESVACSWYEQGLKTPETLEKGLDEYDKNVTLILRALGKNTKTPSSVELKYISKWLGTYNFNIDVIIKGCETTSLAVDSHRFEYADALFKDWYNCNVKTLEDVATHEQAYKNKKKATATPKISNFNQFSNYKQHKYDLNAIENELLSN